MAQFYPKRRFAPDDALDADDVNEVFGEIGSVVSGGLDEHNFSAGAFDPGDFSRMGTTAGAQWYAKKKSESPFWNWKFGVKTDTYHAHDQSGWADRAHHEAHSGSTVPDKVQLVYAQNSWVPIDGMSVSFQTGRTESALLWVMASFQHSQDSIHTGTDITVSDDDDRNTLSGRIQRWVSSMGARYALRLNGAIISETITGAADFTNDAVRAGHTTCRQLRPTSDSALDDKEYTFSYAVTAPAVTRRREAIVIDFILPVPAGDHTVDVVVDVVDSPVPIAMTNRELIVLQLLK